MKNLSKMILLLALVIGTAHATSPIKTLVPINDVYSPEGFDSNDNTEVIVEGYLPNLCHWAPSHEVSVAGNKISITVSALYSAPAGTFCAEMIVPFVETISVGILDKGQYDIEVNGRSIYAKTDKITVAESTSDSVDQFVYANVEYVEKNVDSRVVQLRGYNPSDCFVLDEIAITHNKKNAYSVLPKMKQISDFCPMKMVPFSYEMTVPEDLKADKVLLHVRSMNGKSVNSVFPNTLQ